MQSEFNFKPYLDIYFYLFLSVPPIQIVHLIFNELHTKTGLKEAARSRVEFSFQRQFAVENAFNLDFLCTDDMQSSERR